MWKVHVAPELEESSGYRLLKVRVLSVWHYACAASVPG